MRSTRAILAALVLCPWQALAQTTNAPVAADTAARAVANEVKTWAFSASAYAYFMPDSRDYVQPTLDADRGWLHLQARYNYEALETGSAWVGYNFSGGERLAWEFTPMLGGVFGDTTGIAPGYIGSLSWGTLELSSEGEYVVDAGDLSGNFTYTWSELSLAPVDWCRFGLATQSTLAGEAGRDVELGLLVGFSYKKLDLTTYVFNPDQRRPTTVVAVSLSL
jgi:hypothetical protein